MIFLKYILKLFICVVCFLSIYNLHVTKWTDDQEKEIINEWKTLNVLQDTLLHFEVYNKLMFACSFERDGSEGDYYYRALEMQLLSNSGSTDSVTNTRKSTHVATIVMINDSIKDIYFENDSLQYKNGQIINAIYECQYFLSPIGGTLLGGGWISPVYTLGHHQFYDFYVDFDYKGQRYILYHVPEKDILLPTSKRIQSINDGWYIYGVH